MEYEVGLKLYERVKKGSKLVQPAEEEPLTPTQVAFRFDGEYWNDELRRLPGQHQEPLHRGDRPVTGPLLVLLLAAVPLRPARVPAPDQSVNPLVSKAKETEELIEKLKRDIFKVRPLHRRDRASSSPRAATRRTCRTSSSASPSSTWRRAATCTTSRPSTRPEGSKGAIVSPGDQAAEAEGGADLQPPAARVPGLPRRRQGHLLPGARAARARCSSTRCSRRWASSIRKYPSSPLRLEAEQILGDYYFDKADLAEAEKHYQAILDAPPSPVHDLARYKMGWIRMNQSKHADAVTFFEAAAASEPMPGVDAAEGAQRQARGAAGPRLQLHRGAAGQGRAQLLREALRQPRPPTRWRWTSSATATSSSSSTSTRSPRCAS